MRLWLSSEWLESLVLELEDDSLFSSLPVFNVFFCPHFLFFYTLKLLDRASALLTNKSEGNLGLSEICESCCVDTEFCVIGSSLEASCDAKR